MGTHMKATIEIADSRLTEARTVAAREGTTLRALVEGGLRTSLRRRDGRRTFRLRVASFEGEGLQDTFAEGGWSSIRDAVYAGRGA